MEAIKPKDFLDQIPKPDSQSLSVWRRKRLQQGKSIMPRRKGHCSSCLFCVQEGSIFRCNSQSSGNYGYLVEPDYSCKQYLQYDY